MCITERRWTRLVKGNHRLVNDHKTCSKSISGCYTPVEKWHAIHILFSHGTMLNNLPVNVGDTGSIPELGRSPEVENGNPLQ